MDIEEFQEKMEPTHRVSLCRMLKVEQLPEYLLREYVKAKMMIDRIDGRLDVGDLALIALGAGFNPDTGKFCMTEQPAEVEQTSEDYDSGKELADVDEAQTVEQPVEQAVYEGQVSGATGQAQEQPTAQPAASGKFWSPGMPVSVLHEEDLKLGNIVGIHSPVPGSEKAVQLTVEFEDGETVTVNEDEVEAV